MRRRTRAAAAAPGSAAHRIRIVGGQWRRRPIHVVDIEGLRPTPDRVRETLFNWLGQRLDGWRCLDLFAGTGALGLEAASRGARRVVLVERDRRACAAIARTIESLGAPAQLELVAGDAFDALRRLAESGERFDLVFVDPPFGEAMQHRVLDALPPVLARGGLVHLESEERFEVPAPWRVDREGRAGRVRYHLLSRVPDEPPPTGSEA